MLISEYPGLKEAVAAAAAEEESLRGLAMMSVNVQLCGIEVRQFTPRQFLILDAEKSPFFAGGGIELDHVLQFFWVASPLFLLPTSRNAKVLERRREKVMESLLHIEDFEECVEAIRIHIDRAILDRPAGSGSDGTAIASFAAMLVNDIAGAYSWHDTVLDRHGQPVHEAGILDKPFARLFQYRRLIAHERNPDVTPVNRLSDRAERECIRAYHASHPALAPSVPPVSEEPPKPVRKRRKKGTR
ncbi:MAG: hypothetical protein V4710_06030 [Verrucomicrobiota bacterium]